MIFKLALKVRVEMLVHAELIMGSVLALCEILEWQEMGKHDVCQVKKKKVGKVSFILLFFL